MPETCPICGKKLSFWKNDNLHKYDGKRFCSVKCRNKYEEKIIKSVKGILKTKKHKRNKFEFVVLNFFGGLLCLLSLLGILISIPLVLIIIGIFSAIGFGALFMFGLLLISMSKYKPIYCSNCKQKNEILWGHKAITCKACQKRVLLYD